MNKEKTKKKSPQEKKNPASHAKWLEYKKQRNYLKSKAKVNIFADYQEALKDKELEKEKQLLEADLEDK